MTTEMFIPRIGGKKLLRKTICERFPLDKYNRYIEVFGGSAWVLFAEERPKIMEVYNDFDSEIVNLFRCVKYHLCELEKEISEYYTSRELWENVFSQLNSKGLTDIQRAGRYFLKIRLSYGAKGTNFNGNHINLENSIAKMKAVKERLKGVIIEHKDFSELIKVYDRKEAFFFCDPPYIGTEQYYDVRFTTEQHLKLCEILGNIKGFFLLTYNDCEIVRELYKNFKISEVKRTNNLARGVYKELIITNY